jgi:phosphatidylinositol kinase/protein kinase (PI-3  family)
VQTAATLGKNELQEGLDIIESTKLKYFTKEMTAEFYALKGGFSGSQTRVARFFIPKNIPNYHKIYQMIVKYTKMAVK